MNYLKAFDYIIINQKGLLLDLEKSIGKANLSDFKLNGLIYQSLKSWRITPEAIDLYNISIGYKPTIFEKLQSFLNGLVLNKHRGLI